MARDTFLIAHGVGGLSTRPADKLWITLRQIQASKKHKSQSWQIIPEAKMWAQKIKYFFKLK